MTEKSFNNWHILSDQALEQQIGLYIKKRRQEQNKTQSQVAKAANISRSTLSLLERGESGSLKTLIQILRVLDSLWVLENFKYEEVLSPMALAKLEHKPRKRVRQAKKTAALNNKNSRKQKSNW